MLSWNSSRKFSKCLRRHRSTPKINWVSSQTFGDCKKLGDRREVGRANAKLGNTYHSIFQYQKEIECHSKHLEIAAELGDKRVIGTANANLGNAYHTIGQYQKAITCHRRHLKIAEELEDRSAVGTAQVNLGNAYKQHWPKSKSN